MGGTYECLNPIFRVATKNSRIKYNKYQVNYLLTNILVDVQDGIIWPN